MLNSLRAVARFIQKYIGWNRIGVLLSLTIITVAFVVLYRMLRGIDLADVMIAVKKTDPVKSPWPRCSSLAAISH